MNTYIPKQLLESLRFSALIASVLLAMPLTTASAQDIAVTHCQGECPQYDSRLAANRANIVIHHTYAAALNGETGMADWVAYHLSGDAVGVASLLPRDWHPDELVKFSDAGALIELGTSELTVAEASKPTNPYGGVNAIVEKPDRARLVPMTSFANTPYWSELNNTSNMVPMPPPLRLGAWLRLEQSINRLVVEKGDLYVISGPLFLINQPLSTSASAASFNPAAYFKVVMSESGIATFVFPENLGQYESFCEQRGALDQIERMTGLNLFPDREMEESEELRAELGCQG